MQLKNSIGRSISFSVARETSPPIISLGTIDDGVNIAVTNTLELRLSGDQDGELSVQMKIKGPAQVQPFIHDGGTDAGNLDDNTDGDGDPLGGSGLRIFRAFNATGASLRVRNPDFPVDFLVSEAPWLVDNFSTRIAFELIVEANTLILVLKETV